MQFDDLDPTGQQHAAGPADSLSDATEQVLGACRTAFEAYGEAWQQVLGGLGAGGAPSATGAAFDLPAFGTGEQLLEAGKQLSSAYLLAIENYISFVRRMLD